MDQVKFDPDFTLFTTAWRFDLIELLLDSDGPSA